MAEFHKLDLEQERQSAISFRGCVSAELAGRASAHIVRSEFPVSCGALAWIHSGFRTQMQFAQNISD